MNVKVRPSGVHVIVPAIPRSSRVSAIRNEPPGPAGDWGSGSTEAGSIGSANETLMVTCESSSRRWSIGSGPGGANASRSSSGFAFVSGARTTRGATAGTSGSQAAPVRKDAVNSRASGWPPALRSRRAPPAAGSRT